MKLKKTAALVEASLMGRRKSKKRTRRKDLLSTGSTLLNLACSDSPYGGFKKGKYYFLVGDSTSGKTFFSMTCFAEATINPHFEDYRLIRDDPEDGMLMNVLRLFGPEAARRIEPPEVDEEGAPVYSSTIEEFYYHLDDAFNDGRRFIYVLDSMDGLTSEAEQDKFEEHKKAYRAGKQAPGSYGDGKAKKNSAGIRQALSRLRESGSILIIISQTRDNLGFGRETKSRSGGRALRFYATTEIWTSVAGQIKKTVKGKPRKVGVKVKIQLKKNRQTGKLHEVETSIYPSYGIDDVGSCVDYLMGEGWWSKKGQKIKAEEFDLFCTREKLVKQLSDKQTFPMLQRIVGQCWREIEAACALDREGRYHQ